MGKLDLKKTKKPFVLFQTVISVFIFFKVSVTYQHSKNSGQKILYSCLFAYLFACLPLQNQKYVIL